MCPEQEQQKHKPKIKIQKSQTQKHKHKPNNRSIKPNTKAINTNPATDFSCQPKTKNNKHKPKHQ